ncbi:MAG: hypothetical protein KF883_11100 [Thermomicrobiales bacterium]|nr:hypothetical protein [Thermomicrobiales bacterium]
MRLEINDGEETIRVIGAVVIRTSQTGEIRLDFGPADGPPLVSFSMSGDQARDLSTSLRGVAEGGNEVVLLVGD